MKKIFKFIYFVLFIPLVSCIEEIDMTHYEHEDKIVVNSLFSPDSNFYVQVSKSIGIDKYENIDSFSMGDTNPYNDWYSEVVRLDSPSVELWGNNVFLEKLISKGSGVFRSVNETPKANKKYEIRVSAPELESVSADDIAPEKVKIISANFKYVGNCFNNDVYYNKINVEFTDPVGENNYYQIFIKKYNFIGIDENGNYSVFSSNSHENLYSDDPVAVDEDEISTIFNSYFFSDKIINGQTYNFIFYFEEYIGDDINIKDIVLTIELRSISYKYYLYMKKLRKYKKSKLYGLEDFYKVGDPVIMYTNVENGYGVFVGYSADTITIRKKIQVK